MPKVDVKVYVARRRSEIGRRIRETRLAKGWSQEQVAQALGCTRVTFTRVELGQAELTASELEFLALTMGVSVNAFLQ